MPLYEDARFESGRAAQIGANRVIKCVSLDVRLELPAKEILCPRSDDDLNGRELGGMERKNCRNNEKK